MGVHDLDQSARRLLALTNPRSARHLPRHSSALYWLAVFQVDLRHSAVWEAHFCFQRIWDLELEFPSDPGFRVTRSRYGH
jgi:hypothetical protein